MSTIVRQYRIRAAVAARAAIAASPVRAAASRQGGAPWTP
jgi:hypothetical protein